MRTCPILRAGAGMRPTIAQPRWWTILAVAVICLAAARPARAQTAPPEDPFARRAWALELGAHVAVETWNYNVSHETMYGAWQGFTYGLRRGLTVKAAWPLYYVEQRTADAFLLGATAGLRGRIAGGPRAAAFWEVDVGVSRADTYTPPRGTQFNYLALGAVGVTARVAPRLRVLASLRWIHVSNNGLAGRHRNPDIEAVGPQVGLLVGF